MRAVRLAALAVTAALSSICMPASSDAKAFGISRERFDVGHWRVVVETDRFSAKRRCRLALRNGKAVHVDRAVVFDLPKHINISEATLRIDDAARLAVSPSFGHKPRLFEIGGFKDAKQRAIEAGCDPDTMFVR
jgi:hypothetical protein